LFGPPVQDLNPKYLNHKLLGIKTIKGCKRIPTSLDCFSQFGALLRDSCSQKVIHNQQSFRKFHAGIWL
jgi:hypothetical protein